jgi:hypothetical protein
VRLKSSGLRRHAFQIFELQQEGRLHDGPPFGGALREGADLTCTYSAHFRRKPSTLEEFRMKFTNTFIIQYDFDTPHD